MDGNISFEVRMLTRSEGNTPSQLFARVARALEILNIANEDIGAFNSDQRAGHVRTLFRIKIADCMDLRTAKEAALMCWKDLMVYTSENGHANQSCD